MEKERQSNIELLRLLSMLALPLMHFCVYSLPQSSFFTNQAGFVRNIPQLLCSITVIQVNVFVLISGWFGINTTLRRLMAFYLTCVFYGIFTYFLSLFLPDTSFAIRDALISFFPFSFLKGWWFVKAYICLMLLAPLFNKAIEYLSKKEFIWVVVALTIINVYFGFLSQQAINPFGTNFMQLMYLYFIGRYLALHVHIEKQVLRKWSGLVGIIGIVVCAIMWIVNDSYLHAVNTMTFYSYNNPLALCNSIAVFLFFTTLSFHSKCINWLAKGVFAVYLIHTSTWINSYWNSSLATIYDTYNSGLAWLLIIAIVLFYFFIAICFDHVRAGITEPIAKLMETYTTRLLGRIKGD